MQGIITKEMRERWKIRIEFLKDNHKRLSDWESTFIASIDNGNDLSLKQSFKLGEIYNTIRDANR